MLTEKLLVNTGVICLLESLHKENSDDEKTVKTVRLVLYRGR